MISRREETARGRGGRERENGGCQRTDAMWSTPRDTSRWKVQSRTTRTGPRRSTRTGATVYRGVGGAQETRLTAGLALTSLTLSTRAAPNAVAAVRTMKLWRRPKLNGGGKPWRAKCAENSH
jgi:hypothetical protein